MFKKKKLRINCIPVYFGRATTLSSLVRSAKGTLHYMERGILQQASDRQTTPRPFLRRHSCSTLNRYPNMHVVLYKFYTSVRFIPCFLAFLSASAPGFGEVYPYFAYVNHEPRASPFMFRPAFFFFFLILLFCETDLGQAQRRDGPAARAAPGVPVLQGARGAGVAPGAGFLDGLHRLRPAAYPARGASNRRPSPIAIQSVGLFRTKL